MKSTNAVRIRHIIEALRDNRERYIKKWPIEPANDSGFLSDDFIVDNESFEVKVRLSGRVEIEVWEIEPKWVKTGYVQFRTIDESIAWLNGVIGV